MPKTGNKTGAKGGQKRNTNTVKHGGYVTKFDGRTREAKQIQTTVANWIQDLGGKNSLSSMELSIVADLGVIAYRCNKLAVVIIASDGECSESVTRDFLRFHSALVEGLSKIGLKRRARELPSPAEWLKGTDTNTVVNQRNNEQSSKL